LISVLESSQDTGEVIEKVRTPSVSSVTKADRVSVDTISQVIEELESQPSHDGKLNLNHLNFFNRLVQVPVLELSIIKFRDIRMII
jgi:hypothetical protein